MPPLFPTAALTAVAIALLLTYLVIRTASIGGGTAVSFYLVPTLEVLLNSAGIAVAATYSALIAIPIAFLTVRTDLPWRRFWLIATILPSSSRLCGRFCSDRLWSKGSTTTLARTLGRPRNLRLAWSNSGTHLFSYPYLLLSIRAGLQVDSDGGSSPQPRSWSARDLFWIILPQLRHHLAVAGGA